MRTVLKFFTLLSLLSLVEPIPIQKNLFGFNSKLKNIFGETGCLVCKGFVEVLHGIGSTGVGEGELIDVATTICLKLKLKDVDDRVCRSVTKEFADELWYVIMDAVIEPSKICGWILGDSCAHYVDYFAPWNVTLPARKHKPKDSWHNQQQDAQPKKVLHLSDTHIDFDYMEGSNAVCNEPMCCRSVNGKAGPNGTAAPKWGFPENCDASPMLVDNLLSYINKNHQDIDFIYWTGDVPAHNVWNQSREDQIFTVKQATKILQQHFPGKKIYPALGNHEGSPVNSFPPPYITGKESLDWLLETLAEDWSAWLPEETQETIKRGGFYTVLIEKGFRLISLNMNYGNSGNWWLWINSTDPAGQLQWLVSVLLKAEENNEKVHIIGHIPPSGTLNWFKWNYYRIVDRFHDTIAAQFFGHTHHDHFSLFYDIQTSKIPNNIAYIAPSVTTFNYMNPGFRTYDIDGGNEDSTWNVVNHDTYYADISQTDDTHPPQWTHEYNAKTAYGMKDLSPEEWHNLLERMENNNDLFQVMFRAYRKQYQYDKCDDKTCRKGFLCGMINGPFKTCDLTKEENELHLKYVAAAYSNC